MTASLDRALEAAVVVMLKVSQMMVPENDADKALIAEFNAALNGLAALPHLGVDREAICPSCERLTEIRHCQACGCDFMNAPPAIHLIETNQEKLDG